MSEDAVKWLNYVIWLCQTMSKVHQVNLKCLEGRRKRVKQLSNPDYFIKNVDIELFIPMIGPNTTAYGMFELAYCTIMKTSDATRSGHRWQAIVSFLPNYHNIPCGGGIDVEGKNEDGLFVISVKRGLNTNNDSSLSGDNNKMEEAIVEKI